MIFLSDNPHFCVLTLGNTEHILTFHTHIYQYRRQKTYLPLFKSPIIILTFHKKETHNSTPASYPGSPSPENFNPASSGLECLYNQWVIEGLFLPHSFSFSFFLLLFLIQIHIFWWRVHNTLLHPFIHLYLFVTAEATTSSIIRSATAISFSAFGCFLDDSQVVLKAHLFSIVDETWVMVDRTTIIYTVIHHTYDLYDFTLTIIPSQKLLL